MHKYSWARKISVLYDFLKRVYLSKKAIRYGIIFFITVIFIFLALIFNYSVSSIDKKSTTVVVDIPAGSSFLEITEILDKVGMIKNRYLFYGLAFIKGATRKIRAGEYEFNTSMTPWTIIKKLMHGEIKIHKVVIYEDLSLRDIAAILDKDKLINKEVFFELARDKDFLESLNIQVGSIEGYLFPDTYYFTRSMNTRRIMKEMVDTFWKRVTPSMRQRASDLRLNMNQFVTLASIIGKESGNSFEKPFISAVFYNRMKRGIRLQSDPTAVYDMDNFEGKVLRSHLRRKSPYNTYLIKGLPPGPIGNPGLYSLRAAIDPAPIDCFYFVSKKDGTHHFSSSLEEHNQAVNRYKKIKDEQIQQLKDNISDEEN